VNGEGCREDSSPDAVHAISVERTVSAQDRGADRLRLGNEHSIKGISMMQWQRARFPFACRLPDCDQTYDRRFSPSDHNLFAPARPLNQPRKLGFFALSMVRVSMDRC